MRSENPGKNYESDPASAFGKAEMPGSAEITFAALLIFLLYKNQKRQSGKTMQTLVPKPKVEDLVNCLYTGPAP